MTSARATDARVHLLVGHGGALGPAADAIVSTWRSQYASAQQPLLPAPSLWPFTFPLVATLPATPAIFVAPAIHEAFVNRQTTGTRLVTTQAAYLLQEWVDASANRSDIAIVATADRESVKQFAPEVLARAALFGRDDVEVIDVDAAAESSRAAAGTAESVDTGDDAARLCARAFRLASPAERLALCVRALEAGRTAPTLLAAASVCMEVNDLDAAARDLDEAVEQAPHWAAAHFERGKLWLRVDDLEHASESFRNATERMPGFASAWANLGAVLGELDRPAEALTAFERALALDQKSHQALNNLGVVNRELGHLAQSESAFRQVIQLVPDLAFGYYNLGHTLFLQGRYQAALSAYTEGQRRDRERNPVQATRLALCRLATGDPQGAIEELKRATRDLPREYRQQVLEDTHAIAWALLTDRPDLAGWSQVNDWLRDQIGSKDAKGTKATKGRS